MVEYALAQSLLHAGVTPDITLGASLGSFAATLTALPNDFFWRVVREPIRLRDTIAALERCDNYRYIDVGPAGTLATFTKYSLTPGSQSTTHAIMSPFGHDRRNMCALLQELKHLSSPGVLQRI